MSAKTRRQALSYWMLVYLSIEIGDDKGRGAGREQRAKRSGKISCGIVESVMRDNAQPDDEGAMQLWGWSRGSTALRCKERSDPDTTRPTA